MIVIDGMLLFKMYILKMLHELFVQKHLTTQTQNARLDACYQLYIVDTCSHLSKNTQVVLQLFDFCNLQFEMFAPARHRLYTADQDSEKLVASMSVLGYSLYSDRLMGFRRKIFIQFLRNMSATKIGYESEHMTVFRNEMITLLSAIPNNKCSKTITLDAAPYRTIMSHLLLQYELIAPNRTIKIYTDIDNYSNNRRRLSRPQQADNSPLKYIIK